MKTTLENGGSISHHHSVGRQRRRWLKDELGPALDILKKG
ncbi:MAG: FAD-linked oxidase C-terminal domain-containing protein [Thermoproteota archaeon]